MPVKVMTAENRRRMATRALIFGPPNSRKTTAIIKTAFYPLQIVSFPGETGWVTIPNDVNGLTSYIWEEPPSDPVTADSMRKEIEDTVYQVIAQKKGPCRTIALEGLHKLYDVYLNVATGGSFGRGDDFEAQRYGRAHQMFSSFLRRVLSSPSVDYVVASCWNAREADRAGDRGGDSHEYPSLPGQMAKLITGMFSVLVFSRLSKKMVNGRIAIVDEWLLTPDSDVWGVSVKMDPRVAAKLPSVVPQNLQNLYKVIGAAEHEVEAEGEKLVA